MIYLKRSHFDILLFLIVFYEGDGDVRVCEGVALQMSVSLFGQAFLKNSFIQYF